MNEDIPMFYLEIIALGITFVFLSNINLEMCKNKF